RGTAAPALVWCATAFAVEALRLGSISVTDAPPTARGELIAAGGHVLVAIPILIGTLGLFGKTPHAQRFWALAGLTATALLVGLLDPRATGPAAGLLSAIAAGSLAFAASLFWRNYRAESEPCDLFAAVALALLTIHLGLQALAGSGAVATAGGHGMSEWDALAHLGLSFLTMTSLIFTAQHRALMIGRETQDRLAASEQRFRDIAEVAGEWIWETGPDLRYTYFSDRVQESVGVDPKHLLGRTRRDLMGEDLQEPRLRAHLADLEAHRGFRNFEYTLDAGDGEKRHLRVSGKPIFDGRGRFLGYRGTGTNITEEVVAKETAERLDRRLRDAFESLPYGLALFDAEDRLVLCNSKHGTIYPDAEGIMIQGRRFEDILRAAAAREIFPLVGDDLEDFIQDRLARHNDPPDTPIQQPARDGRCIQISENKTADGGTVTAWSDITWLKRREQALALLVESDRDDRSFFDVAAEALAVGLGCRWSGIGYLGDDERFEALATRGPGWPEDVPSHRLDATPGGRVVESRGYLSFAERVAERFPEDTILAELGVVSYQGQAFLDAEGNPLGHVFAMNDRPDKPGPHDRELVGLIARWVGAEFEQRRIKAALAKSEQRFRDYAETGADWFWETDMDQRFTDCIESDAASFASNITIGMTRDEVQRRINAAPNLAPIIAEYMARGDAFRNLEFRCDDPKLGTRWTRISGKPVRDPDGRLIGYRGSGHDVTAEVAAQMERAKTTELLQVVFEHMAEGVSVTDADLNIVAFNPLFLELLDFPPDLFEIGDPFEKFIRYNAERGEYGPGDLDEQVRDRIELAKRFEAHCLERTRPDGGAIEIRGNPLPNGGFVTTYTDITERKRAETALRKSEASLANAQRIARLGSWDWNIATDEFAWSDEVYRIFGFEPNQFEPTYDRFLDSVHPGDRSLFQKAMSNALAGFPYGIDYRILLPGGEVRIVHEQGEVERDEDGSPAFVHGTVQDVTAHREAVAAVRKGERHVRSIMENVADALVTMDERGFIQSVNPATEKMFGYQAKELIGQNVSVLMPEPHRIEHDHYLRRYLATGKASILGVEAREVVGRRKDGSPVDVELTAGEMWHGGDHLFIGVMRDITERKAAEETLRQKTSFVELSKSVAAAANEALSVEDALQACLSDICTHFGWPIGHVYLLAEDGTGELAPSTIWHLTDREKFGAFRSITMTTRFAPGIGLPGRILVSREPVWIADVTEDSNFRRAQASENIGIKAAFGIPVLVGSEVAAVLEFFAEEAVEPDQAALEVMAHIGKQIGRVIERARAERQLRAAKDAAERADRTKSEFLASMSHELRTPLNAIIGFSEVMGQEMFGPIGHPTYKEYLEDIRTSGTHLLNIINDILDVSKAQAGMIVLSDDTVDLAEVVETCLRLLGPQAKEKGLSLETDLAPTPIRVRGDRQRLSQVLLNLLSNAIKFTTEGSVTVRLRGDRETGVVLEVIDTGIGIAEHDLERVMEPFTQADSTLSRAHEGTGLGLPLSRVLVELHDGTLTIQSTFGEGTVATVRLPGKRVMGRADAA
ncbi:MAG: PAS-domain containing protein, partial [Proteobacteria bacterium]|nr:PAS-domain containing protein [Pseudomonadota bacterium]